ncbi:hypothetical protein OIO90_003127 [Microbotryomycetes sp. JL221]|nr:hypothetical protein OIO90_003127 [Microbotryomycetes sp. JL221]
MSLHDVYGVPGSSALFPGIAPNYVGAPGSTAPPMHMHTTPSQQTPQLSLDTIIATTPSSDVLSLASSYPAIFSASPSLSGANPAATTFMPSLAQSVAPVPTINLMTSNMSPVTVSPHTSHVPLAPPPPNHDWSTNPAALGPSPLSAPGTLTPTTEQALNQAIAASLSPTSPLSNSATAISPAMSWAAPPASGIDGMSMNPADATLLSASLSDPSIGAQHSNSTVVAFSPSPSARKRRFQELITDATHETARSAMQLNDSLPTRGVKVNDPRSLTTVLCLHPWAGQRCYSKEKRLLAPPPIVRIVGPLLDRVQTPRLEMTVINVEKDVVTAKERAILTGDTDRAYFRKLHINGMGKAKNFNLRLTVHPSTSSKKGRGDRKDKKDSKSNSTSLQDAELADPIATFMSADIDVISKPSKKLVNGPATQSSISQSSTVAFLSRINNQSLRTYYMSAEGGRIVSRTEEWSAFSMRVLREPENAQKMSTTSLSKAPLDQQTVPFGSEIILTDILSGYTTEPLVLHQIEKDEVILKHTGPVGQMQRVALSRVTSEGKRIYLSTKSDGMDRYGNPMPTPSSGRKNRKRTKTDRDSSTDGDPVLSYDEPFEIIKPDAEHPQGRPRIADHMIWTIVGVTSFSYSMFDSRGDTSKSIERPLTPFPVLASAPQYIPATHCLELSVTECFYTDPNTNEIGAMQVWLGKLGPLPLSFVVGRNAGETGNAVSLADAVAQRVHEQPFAILIVELPPCHLMVQDGFNSSTTEPGVQQSNAVAQFSNGHNAQLNEMLKQHNSISSQSSVALSAVQTQLQPAMHTNLGQSVSPATSLAAALSQPLDGGDRPFGPIADESGTGSTSTTLDSKTPSTSHSPTVPFAKLATMTTPVSLPLVLIRPSDGIGYLTGRWVNAEVDEDAMSRSTSQHDEYGNVGWRVTLA